MARNKADRESYTVWSTIAVLLSLAGLAESAAGRSRTVRQNTLWVLWFSEDVAWNMLNDLGLLPEIDQYRTLDNRPVELMRVAASLRIMAALLSTLPDGIFRAPDNPLWPGGNPPLLPFQVLATLAGLASTHQFQRRDSS